MTCENILHERCIKGKIRKLHSVVVFHAGNSNLYSLSPSKNITHGITSLVRPMQRKMGKATISGIMTEGKT